MQDFVTAAEAYPAHDMLWHARFAVVLLLLQKQVYHTWLYDVIIVDVAVLV